MAHNFESRKLVVYNDLVKIPTDIKSIVNIERYGDLNFRKKNQYKYIEELFIKNKYEKVVRITESNEIDKLISYINYSNINEFIFINSNFFIIDEKGFSVFLTKINLIRNSLAIAENNFEKFFLRLNPQEIIQALSLLKNKEFGETSNISQIFSALEVFKQEDFFLEVNNFHEFVSFIQSNFELRYFNEMESKNDIIIKRSKQKEKIHREFEFYNFLSEEMKIYFLRPFNYLEEDSFAQYSLERIFLLDLALQWINFSMNEKDFKILLKRLFHFIQIRKTKRVDKQTASNISNELYIEKVEKRVNDFKKTKEFNFVNSLISNHTIYRDFDEIIELYMKKLHQILKKNTIKEQLFISHGDLCFSNILYDKRSNLLKFIDPKGCLKEEDAYFDEYYDLAKLSHSILGNYDFINNGLFDIHFSMEMNMSLSVEENPTIHERKQEFKKIIVENKFNYELVRIYEASLFLSMLPLHIDYPKKLVAYILTAIQIIEELGNLK